MPEGDARLDLRHQDPPLLGRRQVAAEDNADRDGKDAKISDSLSLDRRRQARGDRKGQALQKVGAAGPDARQIEIPRVETRDFQAGEYVQPNGEPPADLHPT